MWATHPDPYTLCDGWPRVRGSSTSFSRNTTITTWTKATTIARPYPTQPPTCSLNSDQCSQWWSSQFSCSVSSGYQQITKAAQNTSCAPYMINEPCAQPADFSISDRRSGICGGSVCVIYADALQLYYWPVIRENYDVCNKTGDTITDTNTSPRTAVVGTVTITSPDVALSIPGISAMDYCGQIGSRLTDVVIALPATAVASANGLGGHIIATQYPINYGDFAPNEVPASAWFMQPICYSELAYHGPVINATGAAWTSQFGLENPTCGTIWADMHRPQLEAPTQVYELMPDWASCTAAVGLVDPPKALQTADVAASVTTPMAVTTPSPTPVQTPGVAQQTSDPAAEVTTATPQPPSAAPPLANPSTDPGTDSDPGDGSDSPTDPSTTSIVAISEASQDVAGAVGSILGSETGSSTDASSQSSTTAQVTDAVSTASTATSADAAQPTAQQGEDASADPSEASSPSPESSDPSSPVTESQQSNPGAVSSSDGSAEVGQASSSVTPTSQEPAASADGGQASRTRAEGGPAQPQTTTVSYTAGSATDAGIGGVGENPASAISHAGNALPSPSTVAAGGAVQTSGIQALGASTVSDVEAASAGTVIAFTAPGQTLTIVQQAGSTILLDGTASVVLDPASPININGLTVIVASGLGIAVGSSTIILAATTDGLPAASTVIADPEAQSVTVEQQGPSLVLAQGTATTTVARGTPVSFAGGVYSVPSTGLDITLVEPATILAFTSGATRTIMTEPDGHETTTVQQGDLVVVLDGSSTATVSAGATNTGSNGGEVVFVSNTSAPVTTRPAISDSAIATGGSSARSAASAVATSGATPARSVLRWSAIFLFGLASLLVPCT
ncbi:hypothetical protein LTR53_005438 [Teratosphaeriaceae sp. CCFEE 6253]|nr:hypothetical protein LTR53_005438 [Teratosphaeriaceae sp. CCFEE 6253]